MNSYQTFMKKNLIYVYALDTRFSKC